MQGMKTDARQSIEGIQELLHLGFRRVLPNPRLAPWVECFWSAKSFLARGYQERLYPDGGSSLLFHFKGTEQGCWFNALQTFNPISFEGEIDSFGIRFKPGGASALLGLTMDDLTLHEVNGQEFTLQMVEPLYQELAQGSFQQRVRLAENWLLQQRLMQHAVPGPVQYLNSKLAMSDVVLTDALKDMGLTRRRIERLFRQQVGMAPNQLKMLLRIRKARYQLKLNPDQLLVDTALHSGYFDQAHFNHHFRNVTGYTPGEYKRKQQLRLANQQMIIDSSQIVSQ